MSYSSVLMASTSTEATSATSSPVDEIPHVLFDGQVKVKIVKAKRTPPSKAAVVNPGPVAADNKVPIQADNVSPESTAEVSLPTPETAESGENEATSSDEDECFGIGKNGYRYKRFSEPGEPVLTREWSDFVIAPFGVIGGPLVEPTAELFMLGMEEKQRQRKEKWTRDRSDEIRMKKWKERSEREIVARAIAAHPPWPNRAPEPYRPWMDNWDRIHPRILEGTAF